MILRDLRACPVAGGWRVCLSVPQLAGVPVSLGALSASWARGRVSQMLGQASQVSSGRTVQKVWLSPGPAEALGGAGTRGQALEASVLRVIKGKPYLIRYR
ncbi:hypothetical protein SAMN05444521_2021 [Streptomyces sp. 3214.6]|nr:hypothetical protein SAMN05444521_2021 [Streptomyces sp. 3214.6]